MFNCRTCAGCCSAALPTVASAAECPAACPVTCSVWYKHRNNLFLPTYAETTSMALVRAVSTATESILFTNIVYWMMGYTRTAGVLTQVPAAA